MHTHTHVPVCVCVCVCLYFSPRAKAGKLNWILPGTAHWPYRAEAEVVNWGQPHHISTQVQRAERDTKGCRQAAQWNGISMVTKLAADMGSTKRHPQSDQALHPGPLQAELSLHAHEVCCLWATEYSWGSQLSRSFWPGLCHWETSVPTSGGKHSSWSPKQCSVFKTKTKT